MGNPDIWLPVLTGLLAFALAYMGVHVTLHPPGDTGTEKLWWKISFWLCAFVSAALIAWQSIRSVASQNGLKAQLTRIETNKPTINVLPAPVTVLSGPQHTFRPTRFAASPQGEPTVSAPNGIAVGGNAQVGSATVNNNYGPQERKLSDDQKEKITTSLNGKTAKISFGYTVTSSDALQYAEQICAAVKAAILQTDCDHIEPWSEDSGTGSRGIVFIYKGGKLPQGEKVTFAYDTPVGMMIKALVAAGINEGSSHADPTLPENEAIVLVAQAPVQIEPPK